MLFFPVFLKPVELAAQQTAGAVVGIVTDASEKTPLPGVHVFLAGSTRGTVTDLKGYYSLTGIPLGRHELGFSMVGYTPRSIAVHVSDTVEYRQDIALEAEVYELGQVVVTGQKNRRWRRQLRTFVRHFLGESENADNTEIVNTEVLAFDQQRNQLKARASEPLIIENKSLGYRIAYTLMDFAYEAGQSRYRGIMRFEALAPQSERQKNLWLDNRRRTYEGSFKHFLRTLASDQGHALSDEGFVIATVQRIPFQRNQRDVFHREIDMNQIVSPAERTYERVLHFPGYLQVLYTRELEDYRFVALQTGQDREPGDQLTYLEMREPSAHFHTNGLLNNAYSVVVHGYMAWERVADMLPLEYRPE